MTDTEEKAPFLLVKEKSYYGCYIHNLYTETKELLKSIKSRMRELYDDNKCDSREYSQLLWVRDSSEALSKCFNQILWDFHEHEVRKIDADNEEAKKAL